MLNARFFGLLVPVLLVGIPGAAPALAHGATAGSKPLIPGHLQLQHRNPAEIVALFARERYTGPAPGGSPRAARAGGAEALLPAGIDALMRSNGGEVILVGSDEELARLADCIRIVDVPRARTGPEREKVVLTLRQSDPRRLRPALLRLPQAGTAAVAGRQLVLEGPPAWLHRALRQVIRAELKLEPAPPDPRAP